MDRTKWRFSSAGRGDLTKGLPGLNNQDRMCGRAAQSKVGWFPDALAPTFQPAIVAKAAKAL